MEDHQSSKALAISIKLNFKVLIIFTVMNYRSMEIIMIHPKSEEDLRLFKQLATRLKAPFETNIEDMERDKAIKLYGKNFVEKIEASERNFKNGKYKILKTEDL